MKRLFTVLIFLFLMNYNCFANNNVTLSLFSEKMIKHLDKYKNLKNLNRNRENHLIEVYHQAWNNETWEDQTFDEFSYDDNNCVESIITHTLVDTAWFPNLRQDYQYTLQGEIEEIIFYQRVSGSWQPQERSIYTYNSAHLLQELMIQDWNDSLWIDESKMIYTYDESDYLVEQLTQEVVDSTWINTNRILITNDLDGQAIEKIGETWNEDVWQPQYRDELFYENDLLDYQLSYFYYNGNWFLTTRMSNEYDAQLLMNTLYENWIGTDWEDNTYIFRDYDLEENEIFRTTQTWQDSLWVNYQRLEKIYAEINATNDNGINSFESGLICFPNPVIDNAVNFELTLKKGDFANPVIEIYNLKGQKIETIIFSEQKNKVKWAFAQHSKSLSSGIYFYQLKTKSKIYKPQKIIIMK